MVEITVVDVPRMVDQITWPQWKRRWAACKDVPTALGLLHSIYETQLSVPREEWNPEQQKAWAMERHCFLLRLAKFKSRDEADRASLRVLGGAKYIGLIRAKALKSVTLGFFKPALQSDRCWLPPIEPGLRDALFWFFDNRTGDFAGRFDEFVREFRSRLCGVEIRNQDTEVRDKALELLYQCEALHTLIPRRYEGLPGHISESFLEKLREFALLREDSLEKAVLAGDQAARVYLILSTAYGEHKKQQEARRLEFEIQQRLQQIDELHASP